jgi:hypothetical protein
MSEGRYGKRAELLLPAGSARLLPARAARLLPTRAACLLPARAAGIPEVGHGVASHLRALCEGRRDRGAVSVSRGRMAVLVLYAARVFRASLAVLHPWLGHRHCAQRYGGSAPFAATARFGSTTHGDTDATNTLTRMELAAVDYSSFRLTWTRSGRSPRYLATLSRSGTPSWA